MSDTRLCFFDWETRSDLDLTITGAMRYVLDPSTVPLILSWGVNDDPIKLWCDDFSAILHPKVWAYILTRVWCFGRGKPRKNPGGGPPFLGVPADVVDTAASPIGYFLAWNCAFDRHVWQQVAAVEFGFPEIKIEQTLDVMAQAQASNLPGSLDMAGRAVGLGQKTIGGKAIMKRFADASVPLPGDRTVCLTDADVAAAIEAWALYLDYGVQDTDLMRDVWNVTRPLDATEWQEYWVSEKINDRGMLADLDVCAGAVTYRAEEAAFVEDECKRITDGVITGPTLTKQINEWVFDRLPDDLAETMVKARDDEGYVTRLTGAKDVMTRLLEDIKISDTPPADEVIDLIELLQFGRSSSAVKFEKILNQQVDGRLGGSYVFNGAGQTGRFSSRGVQVHNLVRSTISTKEAPTRELEALDKVAARVPIEELRYMPISDDKIDLERAAQGKTPISSLLSRLIRPTFIAPKRKLFVWGDWSAIEARVTPWLANNREADLAVLAPFRSGDDLYILNAAAIFNIDAALLQERYDGGDKEAKAMRQAGKVAVLALGFLGGVGALKAMARGYGMRLTNEEAQKIVDGWRDRNRWAKRYGIKCEEAAFSAMISPLTTYKAGLLSYQFIPGLMGGTLVCFLPDGRPITYPIAKIAKIEKFGNEVDAITYLNGMGRRSLWNGLQIENGTQATAASILRQTLVRIEAERPDVLVGHTHDEAINEVDEEQVWDFADWLEATMVRGFGWTEGLPLAAEVEVNWFYTKSEGMHRPN